MPWQVSISLATAAVILSIATTSPAAVAGADDTKAWCDSHGGTVVERFPAAIATSGTPVALGSTVEFCEFTGGEGAEPADSRISVALATLAATDPSMAAAAYLTKPEIPDSGGSANPGSVYCAASGGAVLGGQLAPDGGWVNIADHADVAGLCVIPDLSIIDSWGLAYHTMGTIRGADLAPLFRWHPESKD